MKNYKILFQEKIVKIKDKINIEKNKLIKYKNHFENFKSTD